jgi:hypothetical protein
VDGLRLVVLSAIKARPPDTVDLWRSLLPFPPLHRGTDVLGVPLLTDKTRIHLRSASVRTYTFFTTGFPRFLSIRGARGLLALNQVLI